MTITKLHFFDIVYPCLLALCLMSASATAQSGDYSFANVDYPGLETTMPSGINDSADIVGFYYGSDGVAHGFLYDGSEYSSINYPGASSTGAAAINNSGLITGYFSDAQGTHGYIDINGRFSAIDCNSVPLTNPHGINNHGEVVGVCWGSSGYQGFLYRNGVFTFINYPGGCNTVAYGINDIDQIVGTYRDGCSGNTHGFLYFSGTFTPFDFPGDSQTFALGINNAGVVVGYSDSGGFVWHLGQFTRINTSFSLLEAYGINNTGQIVGFYNPSGFHHGFLATPTSSAPLQFVPVAPCRLIDTRQTGGPIGGAHFRDFPIPQEGGCNIPTTAAVYSLNITLVPLPNMPVGFLSIWPSGETRPASTTMNSFDGRYKANAAIVTAGTQGAVSVYVSNAAHVVLDINGYFEPVSSSTLAFYPLKPCRVADTRGHSGHLGGPYLHAGVTRPLPVQENTCGIPASAQAYSFNFTVIPRGGPLWVFTSWPDGLSQPGTSTLNAPTGTVVANAGIVPAGTGGAIDVWASNDSDLAIDVNGYFAPAGTGGLSLYSMAPCPALDTSSRYPGAPFNGILTPPVEVAGGFCRVCSAAQAYVFNATLWPPVAGAVYFLTLWPDGQAQPTASTLNSYDAAVTSNMAIVPTTNGSIDADAAGLTHLILDISSYFAP